jgi:hypothetical protein
MPSSIKIYLEKNGEHLSLPSALHNIFWAGLYRDQIEFKSQSSTLVARFSLKDLRQIVRKDGPFKKEMRQFYNKIPLKYRLMQLLGIDVYLIYEQEF